MPRTLVGLGFPAISRLLDRFGDGPVILKPNRGGKGSGVAGFETAAAAATAIKAGEIEPSIDGVSHWFKLHIKSPRGIVTRAEFIGVNLITPLRLTQPKGLNYVLLTCAKCQVQRQLHNSPLLTLSIPSSQAAMKPFLELMELILLVLSLFPGQV